LRAHRTSCLTSSLRLTGVYLGRGDSERGLKLSFSGFKSSFYRRQQEAKELQKVSNGFDECPHCGGALANQSAEPEAATDSHPAAIAGGKSSAKEVAGEGMGASFARALEERMLSTPLATRRSKP
ncbi:hypothetical protein ACQCP0_21045, partial [Ralstonia pseudosolanacearum]|uniref:hypothetical protein n=1 Tax=Ralstonia pseudosolanacearum TaxID=1310165 RepID=UPI003CEE8459